jgi:hypothetical protein
MARDAAGAYSLPASNPVVTNTTIESLWANGTFSDVTQAITESLDRNGRGAMLGQFKAYAGSLVSPGLSWDSAPADGWYRAGAGDYRYAIAGVNVCRISGSGLMQWDSGAGYYRAGFREIPGRSVSAATTITALDAGQRIVHPSSDATARIFTVQAHATLAYPDGCAITVVNMNGAGVITITPTDTMRLAGAGTTGNRSLAANGICTMLWDLASTSWIISGTGLT